MTSPWLFVHEKKAWIAYGRHEEKADPKIDPTISPDRPGDLPAGARGAAQVEVADQDQRARAAGGRPGGGEQGRLGLPRLSGEGDPGSTAS